MLTDPASKVSVPLAVVILICVNGSDKDLLPLDNEEITVLALKVPLPLQEFVAPSIRANTYIPEIALAARIERMTNPSVESPEEAVAVDTCMPVLT